MTGKSGVIDYSNKITVLNPPKPIGYWVLYPQSQWQRIKFAMYHKPTDQQIKTPKNYLHGDGKMNNIDIAIWIMAASSVIDTIYTLAEMIK